MKQFFYTILLPLTLLTFLQFPNEAKACHISGLEISYRYIGDSTGVPRQYEIQLSVFNTYRFCSINLPGTYSVCVRSSCFSNTNVNVSIEPGTPANGFPVPNQDECVERTSPSYIEVRVYKYTGVVQLAGNCADWRFSAATACCRITQQLINYTGASLGGGIYVEATLNNTQGQNTSPQFQTPPVKSFCTNNFFVWSQAAIEPDMDSVRYTFGQAQNSGNSCTNGSNLAFAPGYTRVQPLNIQPGTALTIQQNNGSFVFSTGSVTGAYIVKIVVEEYRLQSAGNFWYQVGSSQRDMLVNYVSQCRSAVENGPRINTNLPVFYDDFISTDARGIIGNNYPIPNNDSIPDPNNPGQYLFEWPVIEYNCFDSVITLEFDVNLQCSSISPDGSEFRVVGPDSNLRPVIEVRPECNIAQETRVIRIKLHKPLSIDGDYFLYIKEGTDGNTLLNTCGFPLAEFFTMVIRVQNCPYPVYDLKNVSVINNDHIILSWETDSFPPEVVEGWYFFRSDDDGQTFNPVGNRVHENAGFDSTWIDFSVSHNDVNSQNYLYKMLLQMGGELFDTTRAVTSIFLEKNEIAQLQWDLSWNPYDGWPDPEYSLMFWDIAPDVWDLAQTDNNPTFNTTLSYNLPTDPGDYAIRIDARDTVVRAIDYISESNYIYFSIPEDIEDPDEEQLLIPNVFTPNGDGTHDTYEIQGLSNYNRAHLVVTNRWGNRVFESENYQNDSPWPGVDQKSGRTLPDGVYFYILRLYGGPEGEDVRTGQITLFGGNR